MRLVGSLSVATLAGTCLTRCIGTGKTTQGVLGASLRPLTERTMHRNPSAWNCCCVRHTRGLSIGVSSPDVISLEDSRLRIIDICAAARKHTYTQYICSRFIDCKPMLSLAAPMRCG